MQNKAILRQALISGGTNKEGQQVGTANKQNRQGGSNKMTIKKLNDQVQQVAPQIERIKQITKENKMEKKGLSQEKDINQNVNNNKSRQQLQQQNAQYLPQLYPEIGPSSRQSGSGQQRPLQQSDSRGSNRGSKSEK